MNTTEELKAEAARLKAIYLSRKKANPGLTQEAIAEAAGWNGQSVVSQYFNGRIPLNLSALLKFSQVLKFDPHEVSPRLASTLPESERPTYGAGEVPPFLRRSSGDANLDGLDLAPLEPWSDDSPLQEGEVEIPYYKEVELAAGKGSEVMLESGGRKLRFGKRTLQKKGVTPEAAAAATVTGNSMEPVLPHGSTVAIDTASRTVVDGKMYAINHDGQLRVKLLYRLPGGGLRVRSYNTAEHPDEYYTAEQAESISVIGRVFWYSVLL